MNVVAFNVLLKFLVKNLLYLSNKINLFLLKMNHSTQTSQEKPNAISKFIVLLEDDESIAERFQELFIDRQINIELKVCKDKNEYQTITSHNWDLIICLIMDLNTKDQSMDMDIINSTIESIKDVYKNKRIPVFVHSANLDRFDDLAEKGTIIKKNKGPKSVTQITESIKLMLDSGFFDIFPANGTLDSKIMKEIHSAFINQFKPDEIENIIKSIQKSSPPEELLNRTQEVFERIALRSIYQNMISNNEDGSNVKFNSIEHYYRRTDLPQRLFYTGDIFRDNTNGEKIFIATPRCNIVNNNFEQILVCSINEITQSQLDSFLNKNISKGEESLRKHITDNNIGEKLRFLPSTPQFDGGFVDFVKCKTINPEDFQNYTYIISLVDDLTNDIVRKFATYILRGGISDTAYKEALYYFEEIKNSNTE